MTWILVAAGAAVGAPLRYVVDRLVQRRNETVFPWGTWLVNVVGSFLMGVLVALAVAGRVDDDLAALLVVGFCGAFTTYSTFSYETVQLLLEGARRYAVVNVVGNVSVGVAAAALGWWLGSLLG